ncbi:MAG: HAD-IIIC family phosphatase, partial [Bacteroidota bacterium]|nr:HAD-IIIC family phosphatase [Bacteroidota bacterium]
MSEQNRLQVNFCANFVIEPIHDYLDKWSKKLGFSLEVAFAPYNQVFQQLLNPHSLLNQCTGINCLFIRSEDWVRDQNDKSPSAQVDFLNITYLDFIEALKQALKNTNVPFLIGIVPLSILHAFLPETAAHIITINQQLKSSLQDLPKVHLLDLGKIADLYNIDEIFDAKSDKLGHIPFTPEFYQALCTFLVRKIQAYKGHSYKVIAADCDNTLWKGICGEIGALNVIVDENYAYLQEFLIEKYNEGFLLVLCSKNNEDDVWEVFEKHPGMKLKREHFAAHRINWNAKHGNLLSMAKELNLGPDSFIFLDDSSFEAEQVSFNCPEILSLCLPDDPQTFFSFLNQVWAFDLFRVTEEDRQRNKMYKAEKQRSQEQVNYSSLDDFLLSLNIQVNPVVLQEIDLDRALQLTIRTNQFNLNGIRKTREEISKAIQDHTSLNWIIEVKDRFGNYGKAGLLLAKVDQDTLVIETFLLSCRVLGRNVEDIVLSELQKYCDVQRLDRIIARFQSTSRNQPFLDFLLRRRWGTQPYSNTYYFSVKNTGLTIANKHEYDLLNNPQAGSNENDSVDLLDSKNRDTPQLTVTLPATKTEAALYN